MCHFMLQFMGDRVNAMQDYQAAIEQDATYSLAYFNAGNVYFHTRHFNQVNILWSFANMDTCLLKVLGIVNVHIEKQAL